MPWNKQSRVIRNASRYFDFWPCPAKLRAHLRGLLILKASPLPKSEDRACRTRAGGPAMPPRQDHTGYELCENTGMHGCMHTCVFTCISYISVSIHIHIYISFIHKSLKTKKCKSHINIYVYIYIHTYTHAYMCIYI